MLHVPPFKQTDGSRCGPAAVKMVLGYYNINATEDELCGLCNHSYALGCTDIGMKKALNYYGMNVKILNNSTLKDIEKYIKKGIPVIVDWFTGGVNPKLSDMPDGHSSVVVDIDEEYIYLLDPENGEIRQILHTDFLRVWFDWKHSPIIDYSADLVLRQLIVATPKPKRTVTKIRNNKVVQYSYPKSLIN